MKKLVTVLSLGFLSTLVLAQETQKKLPLVTITGKLSPDLSIKVSQQDLDKISAGLSSLNNLESKSTDINDLMSPVDVNAIQSASQIISDIMLDSAKRLVDMRVLIYKLAEITSVAQSKGYEDILYRKYQKHFQSDYNNLVGGFLRLNSELLQTIKGCSSELCVLQIASAQRDLIKLGWAINQGIRIDQLDQFNLSFQFESSLIQNSFAKTFESLNGYNKEKSAYVTMLVAAATPFVSAAKGVAKVSENIAKFLTSPRDVKLVLYADRMKTKEKQMNQFDTIKGAVEGRVKELGITLDDNTSVDEKTSTSGSSNNISSAIKSLLGDWHEKKTDFTVTFQFKPDGSLEALYYFQRFNVDFDSASGEIKIGEGRTERDPWHNQDFRAIPPAVYQLQGDGSITVVKKSDSALPGLMTRILIKP